MSLLLSNLTAALLMTGLVWFVQVVHYPLFARVGAGEFAAYHAAHERLTTFVVLPVMLVEMGGALAIAGGIGSTGPLVAYPGLALVAAIWLVTFTVQVPTHRRLKAQGADRAALVRSLVRGNWIRTGLWSARAVLLLAAVAPRR